MKRFLVRIFCGDQGGNILILTGLGILFLVGIGGAGYDLGRQQLVRQKIQQASDAAALAAAGMDFGTSDATRQNTAQAFFSLNYPNDYLGIVRPTPSIAIAGETISVSASTSVPTSFVGNFGVSSIAARGQSRTLFKRLQTVLDVVLAMDNSGSMGLSYDVGSGSSLNASGGVRPLCRAGWLAYIPAFNAANGTNYLPYTNAEANGYCNQREGATGLNRLNALRFSASEFNTKLMRPNPLNNRIALVAWDEFVMSQVGFTNNPNSIRSALNLIYGRAGTNSTAGLQQAQTLLAGSRPSVVKAVILLTDGINGETGDAAETLTNQAAINTSSLTACNAMKAQGTLIFTIGFGAQLANSTTASVRARQFLSDCATGPNGSGQPNANLFYFPAADAAALSVVFDGIVGSLKKVQILQ